MTRLTKNAHWAPSAFLAAALLPAPAAAMDNPRREMEAVERALDGAIRQVSPISAVHVLGVGEACRGYRLMGYGAVFVLAPRALPRPRTTLPPGFAPDEATFVQAIAALEEGLKRIEPPEIRLQVSRRLEDLRRMQMATRAARAAVPEPPPGKARPGDADLRAVDAQARALQHEAETSRQEAERKIDELDAQVRLRFVPLVPASPPVPAFPAAPAAPAAPPNPAAAAAPPSDEEPSEVSPLPPPWRFWFEDEESNDRTPEAIVRDVRAAVTATLEVHGPRLRSLPAEEFVTVVVDFFPRGSFGAWERPERTLVVRVRKRDLDERRAGRLAPEEWRQRIDYTEY